MRSVRRGTASCFKDSVSPPEKGQDIDQTVLCTSACLRYQKIVLHICCLHSFGFLPYTHMPCASTTHITCLAGQWLYHPHSCIKNTAAQAQVRRADFSLHITSQSALSRHMDPDIWTCNISGLYIASHDGASLLSFGGEVLRDTTHAGADRHM